MDIPLDRLLESGFAFNVHSGVLFYVVRFITNFIAQKEMAGS